MSFFFFSAGRRNLAVFVVDFRAQLNLYERDELDPPFDPHDLGHDREDDLDFSDPESHRRPCRRARASAHAHAARAPSPPASPPAAPPLPPPSPPHHHPLPLAELDDDRLSAAVSRPSSVSGRVRHRPSSVDEVEEERPSQRRRVAERKDAPGREHVEAAPAAMDISDADEDDSDAPPDGHARPIPLSDSSGPGRAWNLPAFEDVLDRIVQNRKRAEEAAREAAREGKDPPIPVPRRDVHVPVGGDFALPGVGGRPRATLEDEIWAKRKKQDVETGIAPALHALRFKKVLNDRMTEMMVNCVNVGVELALRGEMERRGVWEIGLRFCPGVCAHVHTFYVCVCGVGIEKTETVQKMGSRREKGRRSRARAEAKSQKHQTPNRRVWLEISAASFSIRFQIPVLLFRLFRSIRPYFSLFFLVGSIGHRSKACFIATSPRSWLPVPNVALCTTNPTACVFLLFSFWFSFGFLCKLGC